MVLLENGTRDFQNSSLFERSARFYVTSSENFKHFQYFNFEANSWKTKTFFKKLEQLFLVERTKIETASFRYKSAISEANIKTNKMVTTKWAYHRERNFTSNYFIFFKVLF